MKEIHNITLLLACLLTVATCVAYVADLHLQAVLLGADAVLALIASAVFAPEESNR